MKLKWKLPSGFFVIALLVGGVGVLGIYGISSLQQNSDLTDNVFFLIFSYDNFEKQFNEMIRSSERTDYEALLIDYQDFYEKTNSTLEEIELEIWNTFPQSDHLIFQIKEENKKYHDVVQEIFNQQEERIDLQETNMLNQVSEITLRDKIHNQILEIGDIILVEELGNIQFYNKVTLLESQDESDLKKWLSSSQNMIDHLETTNPNISEVQRQQLIEDISYYQIVTKILGDSAIQNNELEFIQSTSLIDLRLSKIKLMEFNQLILENSEQGIQSTINSTQISFIIMTLSGFLVASILGLYISKSITNRLYKLKKITREIAHGDFNSQPEISGNDEISELANDVNLMANDLQEYNNQLLKAEKLSAIGQLAARLAHDLRNPLAIIKNVGEMLQMDAISKNDEIFMKKIAILERGVKRMTHQIDDTMDFVRVKPLILSENHVHQIIDQAIERSNVPSSVNLNFQGDDQKLFCDPQRLELALSNIITNACQAVNNNGKIVIRIKEKNDKIIIEIEDSGQGIPQDILPTIFEPLVTAKQEGTGLGLASCKTIIEQHKGTISVKNNPTTFTVTLQTIKKSKELPLEMRR
jgi:signal transduction histidine kinase